MYIGLRVKCPLFLSDFNESLNFSKDFWEIHIYQSSWKSVQWEPPFSMRTDRHNEFQVDFRNFSEAPKGKIKLKITTNSSHTHCTVYWHIKFGTNLQNGDVVVGGGRVVTPVIISSYHIVNSSVRSMVCGASSYREIASRHPIHKKILTLFVFDRASLM
jgi:hypothetical protein